MAGGAALPGRLSRETGPYRSETALILADGAPFLPPSWRTKV